MDEDSTFQPSEVAIPTYICDPCWRRAMEFSGSSDATLVDVDEAVRDVRDFDRNEEAANG